MIKSMDYIKVPKLEESDVTGREVETTTSTAPVSEPLAKNADAPESGATENKLVKAVFLHIQKTAGTSIVEKARQYYGESVISHGDYVGHEPEEFSDVSFVSGHFGYDYAENLIDSRYSFTFLRDPVERILSFYYFVRTRDIDEFPITRIAFELSLEQFLEAGHLDPTVKSRIWNHQTWQLAVGWGVSNTLKMHHFSKEQMLDLAISHLGRFSYIGLTETFAEDEEKILSDLGISSKSDTIHANETAGRLRSSDLPASTREMLNKLTELDREVYQEAKRIREQRI